MPSFEERYAKLNDQQRLAVGTVEGAVLVVAGPGSGKTEILALRVAQILRKTDAGPTSILCLTFTDSAASTMRRRLAELVGRDAYRVTIGTFHSFAAKIAGEYPELFASGANLETTEDVERAEIIAEVLRSLPLRDVLRTGHPSEEFTYLGDVGSCLQDLKRAGIGPDTLDAILERNGEVIPQINGALAVFSERTGKKLLPRYAAAAAAVRALPVKPFPLASHPSLNVAIANSLEAAVMDAEAGGSTEPITAWKKRHMEKSGDAQVLKATGQHEKLKSLSAAYRAYQALTAERGLRDFDDLIVDLIGTLRENPDFRADLQERFQYVLVDEYQDTNGAQAELLALLADHPANEGNPNLMVVGDDDQSIYRFHGAGIEHILGFRERYPRATVVTMATNYRSRQGILDLAVAQVRGIGNRLEGRIEGLSKELKSGGEAGGAEIYAVRAGSRDEERARLAALVEKRIQSGTEPGDIAIIGRRHDNLERLVPHLGARGIRVSYDRQRDALADPHVREVIDLARLVAALGSGRAAGSDVLVHHTLSFPFWGIPRLELWQLSRGAHATKQPWLHLALESGVPQVRAAAELLAEVATRAADDPAELVLDQLIGTRPTDEGRVSPFHSYYFGTGARERDPAGLLSLVASLRSVLLAFRASQRGGDARVADFVQFADVRRAHGEPIKTHVTPDGNAVHLLTTHRAKGMEFDTVVILHASTDPWLKSGRGRKIRFPENLSISPAGDDDDDHARALYVAVTRAKRELVFGVSPTDAGRGEPLPATEHLPEPPDAGEPAPIPEQLGWERDVPPVSAEEREVFQPLVADFQLTATQLNDFLNVAEAGPQAFFERHVLRFPQYADPYVRFGRAVHQVLERIVLDVHAGKSLPEPERVSLLVAEALGENDFRGRELEQHQQLGESAIRAYVSQRGEELKRATHVEVNFSRDGVAIGEARITGKADVICEEEDGTLTIIDYKTGRASEDWDEKGRELKRHGNRQQLLFYTVLAENSERFRGKTVGKAMLSFVEPNAEGKVLDLPIEPTAAERERTAKLIQVVSALVRRVELPDVSGYSKDLDGVLAFEEDLLTKKL